MAIKFIDYFDYISVFNKENVSTFLEKVHNPQTNYNIHLTYLYYTLGPAISILLLVIVIQFCIRSRSTTGHNLNRNAYKNKTNDNIVIQARYENEKKNYELGLKNKQLSVDGTDESAGASSLFKYSLSNTMKKDSPLHRTYSYVRTERTRLGGPILWKSLNKKEKKKKKRKKKRKEKKKAA